MENFPRDGDEIREIRRLSGRKESGGEAEGITLITQAGKPVKRGQKLGGDGWATADTRDFFLLIIKDVSRDRQLLPFLLPRRTVIRVIRADKFSYYARVATHSDRDSPSCIRIRVRVYIYVYTPGICARSHLQEEEERSETTVNHFCESRVYRGIRETR